jgi:hypothetical protein
VQGKVAVFLQAEAQAVPEREGGGESEGEETDGAQQGFKRDASFLRHTLRAQADRDALVDLSLDLLELHIDFLAEHFGGAHANQHHERQQNHVFHQALPALIP